jgi:ornithine decarboxylase
MVGDIGTMVTSVLLRSRKQTEEWVYLDAGVFHGLMETIENFRYEVIVDGKEDEEKKTFTLAGPTCDSVDMIYQQIDLPANITYGDIVYFKNTGAYTVEYGTYFNGIRPPKTYILDYA